MSGPPRLLIVEDHAILTQSLVTALRLEGFDEVEALDDIDLATDDVLDAVERLRPQVVLLDLFLGKGRLGIPLIAPITQRGAVVLMLTASTDKRLLAECLEAGAAGIFDKSQPFDQLVTLVSDAAVGRTVLQPAAREELLAALREDRQAERRMLAPFEQLTPKESAVLAALLDGRTADDIAHEQSVGLATVRSHIQSVLRKLGVNSQLAAVTLARRAGWPRTGEPGA